MENKMKIVKLCPNCGKRILDKVSRTSGEIELKCPHCYKIVRVNLSFRSGAVKYRRICCN
jgi:phage FluMu protein Com